MSAVETADRVQELIEAFLCFGGAYFFWNRRNKIKTEENVSEKSLKQINLLFWLSFICGIMTLIKIAFFKKRNERMTIKYRIISSVTLR